MAVVKSRRPRLNGVINRVHLIGVELEGGWDAVPPGEKIEPDGSVKFQGYADPNSPSRSPIYSQRQIEQMIAQGIIPPSPPPMPFQKGELVSKPLTLDKVEKWIKTCYPQHINETCGLHVHLSFGLHLNYMRLMSEEFATQYIIGAVRDWATKEGLPTNHPQWNRLIPNHPWTLEHCAHLYLGDAQAKMKKKDWHSRGKAYSRYTFVNYCAGQHGGTKGSTGTVEIRGFSMPPTAPQAYRAVLTVVDAVNRWLSKIKQREKSEQIVVTARPEPEMRYGMFVNNY